ncbi:MAG: CRISPR-associated endonuclease Cas3'' [Thermoanaerobaculia bacterium]
MLEEHLRETARLAAGFASGWGAGDLAFLAGLWHDLGKFAADWQEFLAEAGSGASVLGIETEEHREELPKRKRGPDHSTAGAVHSLRSFGETGPTAFPGLVLRFAIAAHHAGLDDRQGLTTRLGNPDKTARYEKLIASVSPDILHPGVTPSLPSFLQARATTEEEKARLMRRFETFARIVFSALVDADYLDTESFVESAGSAASRPVQRRIWPTLAKYGPVLEDYMRRFADVPATLTNRARRRVLDWCYSAAGNPRGAFTLTVPTGGGKTLSSLVFALKHAEAHGHDRVIVALPFLSILDQTADVYRKVFEDALGPSLVEHHSNVTPMRDTMANRLASENWDVPLVVTTQVQLFESLFSNRPRHCRKIHNLANSVVVLDEVQTLPVELLAPILDQLQELRDNYGVSLLLTTATQPSLHSRPLGVSRFDGLDPKPVEIVPEAEVDSLFANFHRVEVEWPDKAEPVDWQTLADRIVRSPQALAIVHRRQDAQNLWRACEAVAPGEQIHLSALMCPAHRRAVLSRVRDLLAKGRPCRVVSTQLVEAGVDVDFPVVYRAMAGLESLAQSAGRCNREGLLAHPGRFVVFNPITEPPRLLRLHRDIARVMLQSEPDFDLQAPLTFQRYFDQLYATCNLDSRAIQPLRSSLRFAEVAAKFRMIDDSGETVFVPFGPAGRRAIGDFRYGGPSAAALRMLQGFGVSVFPDALMKLRAQGAVELLHDSIWVLISELNYDPNLGLVLEADSSGLVV